MMDVTAVTDSVNKTQTNSSVKRSRSITTINNTSKYLRTTKTSVINVRDYFIHQRTFADVKIKFHQEMIWCDKGLLAAASPVLCEELLKMNSKDEILSFNNIDFDEFLLLLEFIYPIFNPEINEHNISCLIKLSHRFQFDVLKHACRMYVMKYLTTIRNVFSKCHHSETDEDCFVNDDNPSKNENYRQSDLIEFHDGTCLDAYDIILNLCQWLQTYFYEENMLITQSIISILQQISIDNLHRVMNSIDMNDDMKVYIYKERAQYLEEMHQMKYISPDNLSSVKVY